MRSRRRLVPLAGMAGLLFAACSGATTPSPSGEASASASASAEASASAPASAAAGDVCNPGPAAPDTTLTFASHGGVYQKAQRQAWLEPYSKLTGVTFTESQDSSNGAIRAQVASKHVWDVVDVGNDFGLEGHNDVLYPLDFSVIHKDEILPGFVGQYRVADLTYGVVLAYRSDKTNGHVPQGWADFFDLQKFPGKRGMYDYSAGGIFEVALMADGIAPKDLYPLDIPRAIEKLDTIKEQLVFWPGGAKSEDLIGSGQVTMSLMWNGGAWDAKHLDNKPVEIQWNQQLMTADYLVVPKGTPDRDAAMKFIAWATCAQNNAGPSAYIPYGPTNKNSKPAADKVPDLAVSNVNDTTAYFNDQWLVDNAKMLDDAYNAWKTK